MVYLNLPLVQEHSYILFAGTNVSIKSDRFNVTASVAIDVDVFKLSANNLFVSSSQGGFISVPIQDQLVLVVQIKVFL